MFRNTPVMIMKLAGVSFVSDWSVERGASVISYVLTKWRVEICVFCMPYYSMWTIQSRTSELRTAERQS